MSESEILEPERVGSDTKTQRGTKELRFSADVPSSNEVRDSKPNKIDSLPKWMKTVPTLQQWCILLAVVYMYFAVKNTIFLSYYYSYWDDYDSKAPGAPKFEFISYHKWFGPNAVGPNFASHLCLQILLDFLPGTILLIAAMTLHRVTCLISVFVGIGAWILRLADYAEYMYLIDLGLRIYIIFCTWRLSLAAKAGYVKLNPKLALMPLIQPTLSMCPSLVIHRLQQCPCHDPDDDDYEEEVVKPAENDKIVSKSRATMATTAK